MEFEVNRRILELRKKLKMTQTEFGKELGVGRGVITNIELDLVPAKPLLIQQISKIYGVDLKWLETGEGEMFEKTSYDESIASFIGRTLADEDDTFKRQLIFVLSNMTDEEWVTLEKLIKRLAETETKKEQD